MAQPLQDRDAEEFVRVRITRQPPGGYGVDGMSLRVGRVYNLDSSLASALMADGCAELDDILTAAEKRQQERSAGPDLWQAAERTWKPRPLRALTNDDPDAA